jgi:tRNA threonylcarbamoyladenosine biosynthesis protein TsaE
MKQIIASLQQLNIITQYLIQTTPKDAIIFLTGNLASGKTTLTKAIAKSKGITDEVTSPTFSLQQCYGEDFYHYDLYRIENSEFMELGLFEEFDKNGWHLVEWGDDSLKELFINVGYNVFTIIITPCQEGRKYTIKRDA